MMKKTKIIAIVLVLVLVAMSGCGSGKTCDRHTDANADGFCDKCEAALEISEPAPCPHQDQNGDHACDDCQAKVSECADGNSDHKCDTCGAALTQCADGNDDHKCDTCGTALTQCADGNGDHKCDVCGAVLTRCADGNGDHKCDTCGAVLTQCADGNGDHKCEVCGTVLSKCADEDGDGKCDTCAAAMAACADGDEDHKCDTCGAVLSKCADGDGNHECDLCGALMSRCADGNSDHKCDVCGAVLTRCADSNSNHKCDLCGAVLSQCADENKDHKCDYCGAGDVLCADEDKDHKCDVCGAVLNECADEDKNHKCDICAAVLSECADEDKNHKCDVCAAALSQCADGDKNHKCDLCEAVLNECADDNRDHKCDVCETGMGEHEPARGAHYCAYCAEPMTYCTDGNDDFSCDICGREVLPRNMERVSYYLNISTLEAVTLDKDTVNGMFTITSGTTIRNRTKTFEGVEYQKSVKIGANSNMIKVLSPGTGTLSFLIQNGSSGAATQFITVTAPDGTVYDLEFAGADSGSPVVRVTVDVTEGEWIISRGKNGGTQDIFAISLSCVVEKAEESGFEVVAPGIVDYLCGQQLDLSELRLNAVFANGKTEPLAVKNVAVDQSLVNLTASGTYPLTLIYKDYEPITVDINVYLPTEVILGTDMTVQGGLSAFSNGLYVNHSLREVYGIGDRLDLDGLSVTVRGTLGGETKDFRVGGQFTHTCDSFNTAGSKTLTVSYVYGSESVSASLEVYVVDADPSIVENVYQVKVDASYGGTVGAVEDGYNMFTTVQQALDFLEGTPDSMGKLMVIEAGLYTEKLEITIPNLHIMGVGADEVTIEWDSLYGIEDAGGFSQVTDSTQTVAIRDSAYGVTVEGVTISNYWNSQERMDGAGLGIERGLALLVQADRFIMRDSKLLGIQDTLELFTGRQYFENVFISGYTDFIFGTNNTTLFKKCTVHVIDTVKDDQGTAGYITAFKGSNKGAADAITYGAIFYQCRFTADDGVAMGRTAVGRTWGAYAAVAIIDSRIGGHMSTVGYGSTDSKYQRYLAMNGIEPTTSTVQFVECGNTGAGAINVSVAGVSVISREEAALYTDVDTIFGRVNRNVTWLDPWSPEMTEIIVDDRTYYHFDQATGDGDTHTFDTATSIPTGTALEWDGLLISAENGRVAWNQNANALNMKEGAFIRFTVPAGSEVTVETYPNYNFFTLNGVATSNAAMLNQYYAEETEVTLLSTGDLYLYRIVINPNEAAPDAPALTELKVSGMNATYNVGDTFTLEGAVVKACYSDGSIVTVTDYTVNTDAVDPTAEGDYGVVFSYGGETVTVTVSYVDPNAAAEIVEDTYLDFSTVAGYEAVVSNRKVTLSGSFRMNGSEYQVSGTISFPVKAGTTVRVIPYSNSAYASYTLGAEGEEDLDILNTEYSRTFEEDCVVVYTGLSNNYLVGIDIVCPKGEPTYIDEDTEITFGSEGNYKTVEGLDLEHIEVRDNGVNNSQVKNGYLTFSVKAGAVVTVNGYSGYTSYKLSDGTTTTEEITAVEYIYTATEDVTVTITPVSGNNYFYSIIVTYPTDPIVPEPEPEPEPESDVIDKSITISFGSGGNYKTVEGLDISNIQISDNGGNNSQVKNGYLTFSVKAGAVVTVNGYPGYTSYTFGDGTTTTEEITDATYVYIAAEDVTVTITPVNGGGNYFYSISVIYPAVISENTTISFGSEGNYKTVEGLDISNIQIGDNGGNNSQVKNGYLTFSVKAGATVTVNGYPGYTSYTFGDGTTTTEEITDETYVYTAAADVEITITPVDGNNYFYSIVIAY